MFVRFKFEFIFWFRVAESGPMLCSNFLCVIFVKYILKC